MLVAIGNGSNPLISNTTPELSVDKKGHILLEGFAKQGELIGAHFFIWDARRVFMEGGGFVEQPFFLEERKGNELLVDGVGAKRLVRGMAIADRVQGQDLPQGEAVFGKEVDESIGTLPEIADAMGARQRSDARENAGNAVNVSHEYTSSKMIVPRAGEGN